MFLPTDLFSTYSIVARDAETGALGGAVQTHQIGVGRLIPFAQPGIGVIASQSLVNISFGPIGLAMLREGVAPQQVIDALVASDTGAQRRQVAVVDHTGAAAAFSGDGCIREYGHYVGDGYSVQANMMTKTTVIDAMRDAYESAEGDLAQRMLAALQAAQREDGDIRGMQSAALKVVPGDRHAPDWASIYDLRVDEHETPVTELARLVTIRRAQLIDGQGHQLLTEGQREEAFVKWEAARDLAPDQEELAFWQAVTLINHEGADSAQDAAQIFNSRLSNHPRRAEWLDLLDRLQENAMLEQEGIAAVLRSAIEEVGT